MHRNAGQGFLKAKINILLRLYTQGVTAHCDLLVRNLGSDLPVKWLTFRHWLVSFIAEPLFHSHNLNVGGKGGALTTLLPPHSEVAIQESDLGKNSWFCQLVPELLGRFCCSSFGVGHPACTWERGRTFPLPSYILSASLIIKPTWDKLTRGNDQI